MTSAVRPSESPAPAKAIIERVLEVENLQTYFYTRAGLVKAVDGVSLDIEQGETIEVTDRGRPLYMIGVVAEMLKVHPQTLRFYEKKGLLRPSRTVGRTRMYSAEDVEELARLLRLTRDLGVNLAGVEIIIKMRRRMIEMQKQIEDLLAYVRDNGDGTRVEGAREPREAIVRAASSQLGPVDLF